MKKLTGGGQQAPRTITPHKGGRTERVYIKATPEIKRMAKEIKKHTGKTPADLLEETVLAIHATLTSS